LISDTFADTETGAVISG